MTRSLCSILKVCFVLGLPTSGALPNLGGASGLLNTPLNLSVAGTNGLIGASGQLLQPQPAGMPQFILAGGQLLQGIQGAQLLIPTSQGEKPSAMWSNFPVHSKIIAVGAGRFYLSTLGIRSLRFYVV